MRTRVWWTTLVLFAATAACGDQHSGLLEPDVAISSATSDPAIKLAFGQQPTSTGSTRTIAPPVTVRVLDAEGGVGDHHALAAAEHLLHDGDRALRDQLGQRLGGGHAVADAGGADHLAELRAGVLEAELGAPEDGDRQRELLEQLFEPEPFHPHPRLTCVRR